MKCLAKSLSKLSQRSLNELPQEYPWTDIRLIYNAFNIGILLCPFVQMLGGLSYPEFDSVYENYDGILVGMNPDRVDVGHAVAKIGEQLWEPDSETLHDLWGAPYLRLHDRIFYAWINKP